MLVEGYSECLGARHELLAMDTAGKGLVLHLFADSAWLDRAQRLIGLHQRAGDDESAHLVDGIQRLADRRVAGYVEIVRMALRREPVELHGDQYEIPYAGAGSTGLGKPLKLLVRGHRADIPIYLAALSPKNVRTAFEIADGWLPIFFSPEHAREAFAFTPRDGFEIAPSVNVVVSDDVEAARDALKPVLALYVGGMGARGTNFYNALVRRYGYEDEADHIQQLYLAGNQRDAIAAVPDALVDDVALVGPRERIAERLDAWRESGATTLLVSTRDRVALRTMAELVL